MTWTPEKEVIDGRCIGFVLKDDNGGYAEEVAVYLNRDAAQRAADALNAALKRGDTGL